jgi:hypothetical protein
MKNPASKGRGMEGTSRWAYWAAAWVFLAGIVVQVFLAGMVVVAFRMSWVNHISLGHSLSLPLLVMLVAVYLGRFPVSMKRLTWLLFAVYVLQADVVIFLRGQAPVVAALHPVLALVDFAVALALARDAWSLARQDTRRPAFNVK